MLEFFKALFMSSFITCLNEHSQQIRKTEKFEEINSTGHRVNTNIKKGEIAFTSLEV